LVAGERIVAFIGSLKPTNSPAYNSNPRKPTNTRKFWLMRAIRNWLAWLLLWLDRKGKGNTE